MIDVINDDEAFLFLSTSRYPDLGKVLDNSIPNRSAKILSAKLVETLDDGPHSIEYDGKRYYLIITTNERNELLCFVGLTEGRYKLAEFDFTVPEFHTMDVAISGTFCEEINEGMFLQ